MTARQLQRLIDKIGETQISMAKRLGMSDRQMRRYCSGEHIIPRALEIAARCIAEHSNPTLEQSK